MEGFGLLVLAAIGALLAAGQGRKQAMAEAWQAAGRRLGLAYDTPGGAAKFRLRGRRGGYGIEVGLVETRRGDESKVGTRYQVHFPTSLGLDINITREGFLSSLGRGLGITTDIEVGDPAFDSRALVVAAEPGRVRAWLTPTRRRLIARALETLPAFTLTDHGITVTTTSAVSRADEIVTVTNRVIGLADGLRNNGPGQAPESEPAKSARQPAKRGGRQSRSGAKSSPADQTPQAQPKGDGPRQTPAVVVPTGPPPQATESAARVDTGSQPANRSVSGAQSASLAVADVCADLFGRQRMSTDVQRRFAEAYQGKQVVWSGVMRWVDSAGFDAAFDGGNASRAMIEIAAATPGLSGVGAVHAMLRVSGAEASDLRSKVGQTVAFRGELSGCDGFARQIYVSQATIEEPTYA